MVGPKLVRTTIRRTHSQILDEAGDWAAVSQGLWE